MAELEIFTPEELKQLQQAPMYVIAGAVASETDGILGSMRETVDGVKTFARALAEAQDSLLSAIFASIDTDDPVDFDIENVSQAATADAAMNEGVAAAVASIRILEAKAQMGDADAYAAALLNAATAAVKAARTGGFLGIGAETISKNEAAYMERLSTAMGYERER
ncbi:hypothetical protein BH23CHL5_BH23CHL5_18940 [soil metagenome]